MLCDSIDRRKIDHMIRSYTELISIPDFNARLEYLKLLDNNVDSPRGVSGEYFRSDHWRKVIRKKVMDRDCRFDLGVFGIYIDGPVYIHHINPITEFDIINMTSKVTDLENLISTSLDTHNAIHYKKSDDPYIERKPGDTKLW